MKTPPRPRRISTSLGTFFYHASKRTWLHFSNLLRGAFRSSRGAIEYPLEVMDEIRAFACDELLQLSHGGNEVGGVLFGTRRDDLIRILTWRPIACDHTQGESLHCPSTIA